MGKPRFHPRLHAAALAVSLALAAPAAAQSGGAPAPGEGDDAGPVDPSFVVSSRRAVMVGKTLRVRGSLRGAANRTVRVDVLDPSGLWLPATATRAGADGSFLATWSPLRAGRFVLRAVVVAADGEAHGSSAPPQASSVPRSFIAYRRTVASWYGPGFFGRRTACGQRLTTRTLGVAHRRLPCGTRVAFMKGRRRITVRVVDRGPFVRGVHYDLTAAAARKLGVTQTEPVGVAPLVNRR